MTAQLPDFGLLTTEEAAQVLRVSPGLLAQWRKRGRGPQFIQNQGRRGRVYYTPQGLRDYIVRQTKTPEEIEDHEGVAA